MQQVVLCKRMGFIIHAASLFAHSLDWGCAMERAADVQWSGTLKEGQGFISTQSHVLEKTEYGFATRLEGKQGTSPEELIAAAHASCYSMALTVALEEVGFTPKSIHTEARITFVKEGASFRISASHLCVEAVVPGMDSCQFKPVTEHAKRECPVSKLMNAPVSLEAKILTNERQYPMAAP